MIKPKLMLKFFAKNVAKTGNPLGIENARINRWWKEEQIKRRGEWLFFTGMLYQLTPYIEPLLKYIERLENSKFQEVLRMANFSRSLSAFLLSSITPRKSLEETNKILSNIYFILNSSIDVFYIPEIDTYSGILMYEFGDHDNFAMHARSVIEKLEEHGVRRIVTVDPHTTYALKNVYPKFLEVNFEVKSYIELLDPKKLSRSEEYVIHDPCYYGRYLQLSEVVREKLKKAGINYEEIRNSGKLTNCCGGPIEALAPKISKSIAEIRVNELGRSKIITMCPICLANLRRVKSNALDLSEVLFDGS
ncbi:MAG: (Fe-S)-binding protein [Archaeoglobaceae archaeon]|nr:(Fe-S)-binding protein [Archaeoglobaceae archaeon]MDW8127779.1 (Fe-S)-binding protein [Archaeoglobaceae archaeon]